MSEHPSTASSGPSQAMDGSPARLSRRGLLQDTAAAASTLALSYKSVGARIDASVLARPTALVSTRPVFLNISGKPYALSLEPRVTLFDALHEMPGLTDTKKDCDCDQYGTCIVLMNGRHINSCLTLTIMYEDETITTVEGLAHAHEGVVDRAALHPVRVVFLEHDAFQCSYHTPGQICSAAAMLEEADHGIPSAVTPSAALGNDGAVALTEDEVRECMSGNLCRCGAYPNIVAAIRAVATKSDSAVRGAVMQSIAYDRASSIEVAVRLGSEPGARYIGGGTNLLDLMEDGVGQPQRLVGVSRLLLAQIRALPDGGLRLGAMARNADTAAHPLVRSRYPLLSEAIVSGVSGQLRNMATNGGNLMQHTRYHYFYDTVYLTYSKRQPGSGYAARESFNRMHATLGASEACVATHPSDMAVALTVLDAMVVVHGARGERRIPSEALHRLPEAHSEIDTMLGPGELIVAIDLPPPVFGPHVHYLKVRDRASYALALVSVAAALALQADGRTIREARITLGGVAHKPWYAHAAEQMLAGQVLDAQLFAQAGALAVQGAQPLRDNGFKVPLTQRAVAHALTVTSDPTGGAA